MPADAPLQQVTLNHGRRARAYLLHVPPGDAPPGGRPLLLELHGRGTTAAWMDGVTGFAAAAGEAGFVVAAPDAVDELWNDGRPPPRPRPDARDDVTFLCDLIDDIATRTSIDTGRVCVAGLSNGAAMAGQLACARADRIAAIAQVAGTAGVDVAAACRPARPVALLQIHGTADVYMPYAGGHRHGLRGRIFVRRLSGPSVGIDAWARAWAATNGAASEPSVEMLDPDTTVRRWHGATPGTDVVCYRVEGGGHTWPGTHRFMPRLAFGRTTHTFSATQVILDFFTAQVR